MAEAVNLRKLRVPATRLGGLESDCAVLGWCGQSEESNAWLLWTKETSGGQKETCRLLIGAQVGGLSSP